ncbi:hypothetical protein J5N97_006445 [Dioscorea zingiberensis]|uniref:Uncharacterized protein n=1 Tax=Dioscorea zingiberensis TaxID=325984 RepID=A0A9D5DBF7_9LILI|nr:hypothetical protein J5N97_006445 [Dioscorea zingiberensis]
MILSSVYNPSGIYCLSMAENQLVGTLSPDMGHNLPILQYLYMYGNQFGGTIPASLFNATRRNIVDISDDNLHGLIHGNIGLLLDPHMERRRQLVRELRRLAKSPLARGATTATESSLRRDRDSCSDTVEANKKRRLTDQSKRPHDRPDIPTAVVLPARISSPVPESAPAVASLHDRVAETTTQSGRKKSSKKEDASASSLFSNPVAAAEALQAITLDSDREKLVALTEEDQASWLALAGALKAGILMGNVATKLRERVALSDSSAEEEKSKRGERIEAQEDKIRQLQDRLDKSDDDQIRFTEEVKSLQEAIQELEDSRESAIQAAREDALERFLRSEEYQNNLKNAIDGYLRSDRHIADLIKAVEEYRQSSDFKSLKADIAKDTLEDFKNSVEFKGLLYQQVEDGYNIFRDVALAHPGLDLASLSYEEALQYLPPPTPEPEVTQSPEDLIPLSLLRSSKKG